MGGWGKQELKPLGGGLGEAEAEAVGGELGETAKALERGPGKTGPEAVGVNFLPWVVL